VFHVKHNLKIWSSGAMEIDFTPFFEKYEEISAMADAAFARVKQEHVSCVKCKSECVDCCYALFDLTLIEALHVNHYFRKRFAGQARDELFEKSNKADRKVYQIKRKAYKAMKAGKNEDEILSELAQERVRCPLLNERNRCDLYEYRPITCRIYGIPTSIKGRGHTCGKSGFIEGKRYPTVDLDRIQRKLFEISEELVKGIKTKHVKMSDMLVPVSMAILTEYDESHLGIGSGKKTEAEEQVEEK